jgi:CubicO group peptidase (beta-lactamase class C family)
MPAIRRILLIALVACSVSVQAVPQRQDGDGWELASPDAAGLDRARLEGLTRTLREWPELGVHALLIEREGRLVYEEYFPGHDERWGEPLGYVKFTRDTRHDLRSITKSVISALVGIAVASGAIRSLNLPIVDFFPEYSELNTPERRRVTLAHALSMSSGLEWNERIPYSDPRNDEIRMTRHKEPLRFALSPRFVAEPGTRFNYNGGLTQVVAAVLERATKMPLEDYARAKLFEPLGITGVEWMGDLAGMPAAASGLRLRARDLARFGSLYLHGGRWNGKQILPADWVEQSTRRHVRLQPDGDAGYGYFWWYQCHATDRGPIEVRAAVGNGQQRIFVVPGLKMVVTMLAGRYNDFTVGDSLGVRILRDHVIPAVRTDVTAGCPGAAPASP